MLKRHWVLIPNYVPVVMLSLQNRDHLQTQLVIEVDGDASRSILRAMDGVGGQVEVVGGLGGRHLIIVTDPHLHQAKGVDIVVKHPITMDMVR